MKSAGKARSNGLYRHIRTSKEIIRNLLNYYLNNMALSDAEALKMDQSAAAENICGCAFCILTTVQTDGFDRCPRFLRRHEVRYMEAYFVMG